MKEKRPSSALLGAAFLMATSAIGPGFLTQTSKFTEQLLTSFGFVILISLLLDIGTQINIWRIISLTNKRAQDIANAVLPGLGLFLAILIGFGGLVFNVGNFAGTGLGLNALTGMSNEAGATVSALIALFIFWSKNTGKVVDIIVKFLGIIMILFTLYIAFSSGPPLGEAVYRTFWPEKTDALMIVTLVGGTVGGYISFAGAHRLIDAGITGREAIPRVTRSAIQGILLTTFMRYILFLAVLGVVSKGIVLDANNPAGSVFQKAAGDMGYRFFGLVMWSAAITSVIGASYTSVSFFRTIHPFIEKHHRSIVSVFIILSAAIFIWKKNPVSLLLLAGAVNGLILPVALAVVLVGYGYKRIVGEYTQPLWLKMAGWMVVGVMSWMAIVSLKENLSRLIN
jgi:Mn2+/Fe2+ NRAMP family transporter